MSRKGEGGGGGGGKGESGVGGGECNHFAEARPTRIHYEKAHPTTLRDRPWSQSVLWEKTGTPYSAPSGAAFSNKDEQNEEPISAGQSTHLEHVGQLGVTEGHVALSLGQSRDHVSQRAQRSVDVLGLPVEREWVGWGVCGRWVARVSG